MNDIINKRELILQLTEEILPDTGDLNTILSDISKRSGIQGSNIYYYFKNKEDLFFTLVERTVITVLLELDSHLQGIQDPVSRLRKLLWFTLSYHDKHPAWTNLLFFKCRSNKKFYQHSAYKQIRKWGGLGRNILQDGVEKGLFRSDVNLGLIRDIIFGTIDWETLKYHAAHETEGTIQDIEKIISLVLPMIIYKPDIPINIEDKSHRILVAAEQLFSKKGYAKATISDIATLAKVGEGTVYEYFKNKEDLLLSIPRLRFKEQFKNSQDIFDTKSPTSKIKHFFRFHFTISLSQPDFLKLFLFQLQFSSHFFQSEGYKSLLQYSETVNTILNEGKEVGEFRKDIDNRVFQNLWLGSFCHMVIRWLTVRQKTEVDKTEEIDEFISLLVKALCSSENKIVRKGLAL
jgi:TetR/AcrR family transcriptional regulator, fatty acid metabolism regulator protein